MDKIICCPICNRDFEVNDTSKHHVVPKSRGGKEIERICNICHKQLHALFTVQELEILENIESLKNTECMQKYLNWVKKNKPVGKLKTKKSKSRGSRL